MDSGLKTNTVIIANSRIKKKDNPEVIQLTEYDFHPCHPFFIEHPDIKPEAISHVIIKGVLEQYEYIRTVLRYCDYMLAPGGLLDIYFYNAHFDVPGFAVRGRNEWQCELSLVFQDRVELIHCDKDSVNGHFVYRKNKSCLPEGDTIDRWSFGIVSDGRRNERIMDIIRQIKTFNIKEYEVIICGPAPSQNLDNNVRVIDDSSFYSDLRIPISKKKNAIISQARYNNLIIMHDRISFSDGWYGKMKDYGNYYDCLCTRILMEGANDSRMNDWSVFNGFHTTLKEKLKVRKIVLDYNEWTPCVYVSGGFMQIKRDLAQRILLNPNLYWGEKEDVDFSQRLVISGVLIEFYSDNVLYSEARRFYGGKKRKYGLFGVRAMIGTFRRYLKEQKSFHRYLDSMQVL